MSFVLPEGLAPEVYPLAWLVGRWRGEGVVGYPGITESTFTQEMVFAHDGGPYLSYSSVIRLGEPVTADGADEAGEAEGADGPEVAAAPATDGVPAASGDDDENPVWATESGFWRVPPDRPDGLDDDKHPLEVLVADPSGHVAVYVGEIGNGRIDLASDLVARTPTGADVTAATRLYGLVQGDLMWAHDLAAFGRPLQSYASARLVRVPDAT